MLNDNLLPPQVPGKKKKKKTCPFHVNIYPFIALLTDFLVPKQKTKPATRNYANKGGKKMTTVLSEHSLELAAENDGDDEFTCAALIHEAGWGIYEGSSKRNQTSFFPPPEAAAADRMNREQRSQRGNHVEAETLELQKNATSGERTN